ncbi:hypothetical protein OU415_23270 [Saccharopolyspora sp. WRP15-2]|uniref:PPE family protein n=1 Tax=Saccharopolyspora oryzae TaxID=2997343 RepID=A0ABT4V324_9PSEU|nr:hypothetical protein [Saccharopolyspora oryzae]MDA3628372.1 hypothetical protein [Saccharopolyspora oryzae]
MELFGWLFGTREVPGRAQVEFDHQKIYRALESGPGFAAASRAAAQWRDQVSAAFAEADADLCRVLKKFDAAMQGHAGERAKESTTPLSQSIQDSIDVAAHVSGMVAQQTQVSADFKNSFPAPHPVPPANIGLSDYVNPVAFGFKSGVRAAHEEKHAQVEADARRKYESYAWDSNDRVDGMLPFAPPPEFDADVEPARTVPVNEVDPSTSSIDRATPKPTSEASPSVPVEWAPASNPITAEGQQPADFEPSAPAESDSAWVAPAADGGTPLAGGVVPDQRQGGAGGSIAGGAVVSPGESGGRQRASLPRPGTGTGRGGGTGTGRGVPGAPGGGGRSGTGSGTPAQGAVGSSGPGARGASGGAAVGGPASGGRGQREEEKEHGRKFVRSGKDAWEDLEIPKVAPPVFGDWEAEALRGKPPRPPEEK